MIWISYSLLSCTRAPLMGLPIWILKDVFLQISHLINPGLLRTDNYTLFYLLICRHLPILNVILQHNASRIKLMSPVLRYFPKKKKRKKIWLGKKVFSLSFFHQFLFEILDSIQDLTIGAPLSH